MKIIEAKIIESTRNQLPFVVYNKPNMKEVVGFFQKNNELNLITNDFDKQGFVFAPFKLSEKIVLFQKENCAFIEAHFEIEKTAFQSNRTIDETSKDTHVQLVKSGVEAIVNNQFKKVVLSRKEIVQVLDFDVVATYKKLLETYPNAFVYVWFHPKVGLWFGATPETLVKLENNSFTTMALAGTQVFNENQSPNWSAKEIDEQQFVTEYIVNKLSKFSKNIQLSETQTVKAGSLLHLKTEIRGALNTEINNSLFSLVDLLHPTPAVCGLPKEAARQFILDNENYNRSYYTGFLGELNMNSKNQKSSHLFVNLRCMEIEENAVSIYVGGGITKESIPEKEWEETVAKSKIMLNVL
mgnify:CR=1 FL=1